MDILGLGYFFTISSSEFLGIVNYVLDSLFSEMTFFISDCNFLSLCLHPQPNIENNESFRNFDFKNAMRSCGNTFKVEYTKYVLSISYTWIMTLGWLSAKAVKIYWNHCVYEIKETQSLLGVLLNGEFTNSVNILNWSYPWNQKKSVYYLEKK